MKQAWAAECVEKSLQLSESPVHEQTACCGKVGTMVINVAVGNEIVVAVGNDVSVASGVLVIVDVEVIVEDGINVMVEVASKVIVGVEVGMKPNASRTPVNATQAQQSAMIPPMMPRIIFQVDREDISFPPPHSLSN